MHIFLLFFAVCAGSFFPTVKCVMGMCLWHPWRDLPLTLSHFLFREQAAEFSQELIDNCAAAFRAEERAKKTKQNEMVLLHWGLFSFLCARSKCGGSFAGVLADEAEQRGRPAQRCPGCLWNGSLQQPSLRLLRQPSRRQLLRKLPGRKRLTSDFATSVFRH